MKLFELEREIERAPDSDRSSCSDKGKVLQQRMARMFVRDRHHCWSSCVTFGRKKREPLYVRR